MLRSTGTIRYSPKLKGEGKSDNWWLIVDTCADLSRYYRYWWNYNQRFWGDVLIRPAWQSHISVVRNEQPANPEHWEKYAGHEIEFEYCTRVMGGGDYYWLDVVCDRLIKIREELGLPPEPEYPFHLTVGRLEGSASGTGK